QKDVDLVISARLAVPELVFDPEGRENEGVILRRMCGVQPDFRQAMRGTQVRVEGDVVVVVPDEGARGRRAVGREDGGEEQSAHHPRDGVAAGAGGWRRRV